MEEGARVRMTTSTGELLAYQRRAANISKPATHNADVARLIAPGDMNTHTPDEAQALAADATNYFADWSEYQPVVNSTYAYPVRMFRCHSGYRTDTNAPANWADTETSLSKGITRIAFTYPVFVPGQLSVVMAGIKNVFGASYPTNRLAMVIDMESGSNFAGPGNHSAEANEWAEALAAYTGTPVDLIRSHAYANAGDFASCWPQINPLLKKHTAAYTAKNPGTFAWQYQGGNPAYPAPAGAPRSYAPFGSFIDGNVIYDTITNIELALGITAPPIPEDDDMPTIIFDASSPGRVALLSGGLVYVISNGATTNAFENAVSHAGVPANVPVLGIPTADFNGIVAAGTANAAANTLLADILTAVSGTPAPSGPITLTIDPATLTVNGTITVGEQA